MTPIFYRCAFRVSDCHGATIWRIVDKRREFYVCWECERVCEPVAVKR